MKISIVTPSYNQGQFIEESIRSVLDQKYDDFEHIIIDAGSTDNTLDVLRKFPHLNWVSEPDDGQSDAINKGVQKATGDYVLWLNADDYMKPNAFSEFIKVVKKDPEIDFAYGHTCFKDEGTSIESICYHIEFLYRFVALSLYSLPSTGSFIRTSFFKENPLDVNYHMVMDTEWVLRCGRSIKTKLINEVLVTFRVSSENKTASNIKEGIVTDRHLTERESYREKHIADLNVVNYAILRNVYRIIYYALKFKSKSIHTLNNLCK